MMLPWFDVQGSRGCALAVQALQVEGDGVWRFRLRSLDGLRNG